MQERAGEGRGNPIDPGPLSFLAAKLPVEDLTALARADRIFKAVNTEPRGVAQVATATWVYRKHIHNTALISCVAGHQIG